MSKIKLDILESIKEFTLFDDAFMTKVFEGDIEGTQFLLRIIFDDDKIKVKEVNTQKRIKNLQGRDLQLDILAEKADGTQFNVEVQNENRGAIPQRARYHLSVLDGTSLPKGKYYDALPDNYVIFITKNDVLDANLPIYHIHRTIDETGKRFVDGSHIIYVNSQIQDETPLGRLMHDFCCKEPKDMHYKELADRTRYFKENEEGLESMGDVMEKLMAKREREAVERIAKKYELKLARAEELESMGDVMEKLMAKCEREAVERIAKKYELKLARAEAKALKEKAKAEAKAEAKAAKAEAKAMKAAEEKAKAEAKAEAKAAKAEAKAIKAAEEKAKAEAKAARAEAKAAKAEKLAFAKKMLKNNESIEKIVLYSSLSYKEVAALAAKMSA